MPSALAPAALLLALMLGAWSCGDTTCEDACEDEHDDCQSEPLRERPLGCDREYDQCLAVCTSRPDEIANP
jgi:hypothetical protein